MFRNPTDGSLWLLFSIEKPTSPISSAIMMVQLDATGLNLLGQIFTLANYSDLSSIPCLSANSCLIYGAPYGLGNASYIENPQMVVDPEATTYTSSTGSKTTYSLDVFVSYGTWNVPDSYHTLSFACVGVANGQNSISCAPSYGLDETGTVMGSNYATALNNPGGFSLLDAGNPNSHFGTPDPIGRFAAPDTGAFAPRLNYYESTLSYCDNGQPGWSC